MTENVVLIETSFAGAIAIIAAAQELPEQTRRHWSSSLRQIAKALDKPVQVIPARYNAVRADLVHLHHAPAGLTAKTLQNHKSNAKSALLWLAREKGVPEHGAPLTPVWQDLWSEIGDALVRSRLSSLMRFCSANKIAPAEVDEAVLDRFMDYRSRTGSCSDDAFRRLLARAWNANVGTIPGWPVRTLTVPLAKPAVEQEWEDFPAGLRWDVDQYLQGLTKVRRSRTGQRIRPLKPSTIRTRRAELQAACDAGVDALVTIYHSEHRELCAHEFDWPFRIVNLMEVLGQSMGLHRHDRYKELKLAQDADLIVGECHDLIAHHAIDPALAREMVVKAMLGDQPLPLGSGPL